MRRRDISEQEADQISSTGWLSRQPPAFRAEVLRHGVVQCFAAGHAIYHLGDPPGGIYGLLRGRVQVISAPGPSIPRLVHVAGPGLWMGEGPFITDEPRRLTLRVAVESQALHLTLEAMEAMAARDPSAVRRFAQIPMLKIDLLARVIHDLLIRDADRRVAAVLLRLAGADTTLHLSQEEIGDMASATRKQVNFALRRFAERGWLGRAYRSVTLRDLPALRAFVATEDEA